jgi:hypothetical protein
VYACLGLSVPFLVGCRTRREPAFFNALCVHSVREPALRTVSWNVDTVPASLTASLQGSVALSHTVRFSAISEHMLRPHLCLQTTLETLDWLVNSASSARLKDRLFCLPSTLPRNSQNHTPAPLGLCRLQSPASSSTRSFCSTSSFTSISASPFLDADLRCPVAVVHWRHPHPKSNEDLRLLTTKNLNKTRPAPQPALTCTTSEIPIIQSGLLRRPQPSKAPYLPCVLAC